MKKLQLKFAGQELSKEQMKGITGGEAPNCYPCVYSYEDAYVGDIIWYCAANGDAAQSYCDGDCWSDEDCSGCDCSY